MTGPEHDGSAPASDAPGARAAARGAPPVTSLWLFGFEGAGQAWAFAQMARARAALATAPGVRFWKLLGSGRGGGFDPRPDWSRYGLLAVFADEAAALAFERTSPLLARYARRARELFALRLRTLQAHGAWAGRNPFLPASEGARAAGPVAVLTRAAIRVSRLGAFWSAVPAAAAALDGAPGLLLSTGIGEAPLLRQGTFSVWRSEADLRRFAYQTEAHRAVIARARGEGWYREELFARFAPVAASGQWFGRNPLAAEVPA